MLLVLEFCTPLNGKKFQHYIKLKKYLSNNSLGLSVSKSNSGSFKDQLRLESKKIVEQIYKDKQHSYYLAHHLINKEEHVLKLVRAILGGKYQFVKKNNHRRVSKNRESNT